MSNQKPQFYKKQVESSMEGELAYQVFLDEYLVAEVRGTQPSSQTIIPMRELSSYEEDKLHEYISAQFSSYDY